jgi:hypothetical protein
MNELLARIIDAHGGMDRWKGFEKVDATIVSGGGLFALKDVTQDPNPRRMTVWLHEERSSVLPYGAPDQRTMFTPERIAIEKLDGALVAERYAPRDSFAGHQPVLLGHHDLDAWLTGKAGVELLRPAPNDLLRMWPGSKRVNVSNRGDDDASLIEPVEDEAITSG